MKKMQLITASLLLLILTGWQNLNAQTFDWAKQFSGTNWAYPKAIVSDDSGNVFTAGYFLGTVDFDPSTNVHNISSDKEGDMFITKLDNQGNFLWAIHLGDTMFEYATSLAIDEAGNILVGGIFSGNMDFETGSGSTILNSPGVQNGFIAKYSNSGSLIWAKQYTGLNYAHSGILALNLDQNGNIYAAGDFSGTIDFNPSSGLFQLASTGTRDAFLTKLDSSGNFLWAGRIGGDNFTTIYSLATDATGNVVAVGRFKGSTDFNPGNGQNLLTANGGIDAFACKINASGIFEWAKYWGNTGTDVALSVVIDGTGNILTSGSFEGTVDFDLDNGTHFVASVGSSDAFVLKLNSNGNLDWIVSWGSGSDESANSLALDAVGNAYLTGNFTGTIDFDPDPTIAEYLSSAGYFDIFITKLTATGILAWAKQMGGTQNDQGIGIAIDANLNILTTGLFADSVDFDFSVGTNNLIAAGPADIYVHKIIGSAFSVNEEHNLEKISVYPNPSSGIFTIDAGNLIGGEVEIFDLSGRMVLRQKLHGLPQSINLSSHPAGVYTLHFILEGKPWYSQKLIKF